MYQATYLKKIHLQIKSIVWCFYVTKQGHESFILFFYFILFYFILFYFILFYFILFYFSLFYSIHSLPWKVFKEKELMKAIHRKVAWENIYCFQETERKPPSTSVRKDAGYRTGGGAESSSCTIGREGQPGSQCRTLYPLPPPLRADE